MTTVHLGAAWIKNPHDYLPSWTDRTIAGHLTAEWPEGSPLRDALEAEGRRRGVTCLDFTPDKGAAHAWCRRCGWQKPNHPDAR